MVTVWAESFYKIISIVQLILQDIGEALFLKFTQIRFNVFFSDSVKQSNANKTISVKRVANQNYFSIINILEEMVIFL